MTLIYGTDRTLHTVRNDTELHSHNHMRRIKRPKELKSMNPRLVLCLQRLESYEYAESDNSGINNHSPFSLIRRAHVDSRRLCLKTAPKQNSYHSSYPCRRENRHDTRRSIQLCQRIAHRVPPHIRHHNPQCASVFSVSPLTTTFVSAAYTTTSAHAYRHKSQSATMLD